MSRWLYPILLVVTVLLSSLVTMTVTAQPGARFQRQPAGAPPDGQELVGAPATGGARQPLRAHRESIFDQETGRPLGYYVVRLNTPQALVLVDEAGKPFAALPVR